MIRRHFPFSQFLIVSLKEGMFANANVIFRTRFADGVSGVVRTENAGAGAEEAAEEENAAEAGGGGAESGAAAPGKAVAGAPTATLSAGTAEKGGSTPSRAALEEANGR